MADETRLDAGTVSGAMVVTFAAADPRAHRGKQR
jgi:hypothetical protein